MLPSLQLGQRTFSRESTHGPHHLSMPSLNPHSAGRPHPKHSLGALCSGRKRLLQTKSTKVCKNVILFDLSTKNLTSYHQLITELIKQQVGIVIESKKRNIKKEMTRFIFIQD